MGESYGGKSQRNGDGDKIRGAEHASELLLTILCASAFYIVAPALLNDALPEANPATYLTISAGITFPLNIVLGIPIYW